MSHTPGPWGATTRRGSWDWVVYQEANPNTEICQPFHDGTEFNETGEANARLIAAAPDMLKALTDLIATYEWCSVDPIDRGYASLNDAITDARKIVSTAMGRNGA